jgi:hypothetical protein
MTESFYVNASGPAKFSVFGRVYKPQGGEVCGPFPLTALEQVNLSQDRHLLHIVRVEVPAEVLPKADEKDEYFEPLGNTVDAKAVEDPFISNALEKVDFFPDSAAPVEEPAESTVGEVLPEPIEAEPALTSSLEPLVGSFTAEEVDDADDEDAPKVRSRRSRKPKAE